MKRIFFAVDVHGSTLVWRKWIGVPEVYKANVLILAGDLTGKVLVPIIKQPDGTYTASYFGRRWVLKTEAEIREMEEKLENAGAYYIRVTREEFEDLKANPQKVDKIMSELMRERLRKWLEMLVQKINTREIMTIVMPGNDDDLSIDEVIKSFEDKGVIYPLDKVIEIEGHEVISSPYVNPTPWNTYREMDERQLEKHLRS
jgi:Icc-related predicted phosphoesterase